MTKRREPLTFHLALTKAAAILGGWDTVGGICGVTPRAASNWSEPDTNAEIRLIDAERIDRACLDHGSKVAPFHQVYSLRLDLAGSDSTDICITRAAAATAKETGEAVAALIVLAQSANAEDRRTARREIEEAIATLTGALAAIDRQEGNVHER